MGAYNTNLKIVLGRYAGSLSNAFGNFPYGFDCEAKLLMCANSCGWKSYEGHIGNAVVAVVTTGSPVNMAGGQAAFNCAYFWLRRSWLSTWAFQLDYFLKLHLPPYPAAGPIITAEQLVQYPLEFINVCRSRTEPWTGVAALNTLIGFPQAFPRLTFIPAS
jgi:hypothetical protein